MVVDDGPSHLASGEHIALLSDFHARVLKSHLEELAFVYSTPNEQSTSFLPVPVECQGLRHVIAEESTPTGLWSYPNVASSTIPKKVKPAPLTPIKLNPAEATLWTCKVCDRAMHEGSKSAHLAGKAHAKKLKSDSSVLLDHPHVSSTKPMAPETKTWTCPSCKAVCLIREKMYHRCARSMFKASTVDGPLDEFFSFYPSFHYDPSVPPATSFRLLQSHLQQRNRWARESPENDETWYGYQAALIEEFNLLFGIKDNLDAWQCLCRAVRISPLPTTIALCRSAVRDRHVNIIDLIEWGRNRGNRRKNVQIFPTIKKLSDYSFESKKIFSRDMVDELEPGAVLKYLLRPLEAARYQDG